MARFCTSCGAALSNDLRFCTECGTPLKEQESAAPAAQEYDLPAAPAKRPQQAPRERAAYDHAQEEPRPARRNKVPGPNSPYAPITTWGFVGTMLLLSIPLVGLILAIVWACGNCRKINKRNLSRAFLILTAIGLVIGLAAGLILKGLWNKATEASGLTGEEADGKSIFGMLAALDDQEPEAESSSGGNSEPGLSDALGALGALGALNSAGEAGESAGSDLDELSQLADLMEGLGALTGDENGGDALNELIGNVEDINADAEAKNDGWPPALRAYPGGTARAVASYRTEISGTTLEDMKGWIEDLKGDGFEFQDFYGFGMSESDMLGMNAWWATDGNIYLSVSYYDGLVTIDHTKELPDLESFFG